MVDHINKIRDDNRVINLRLTTSIEQANNRIYTIKRGRSDIQYDKDKNITREWSSSGIGYACINKSLCCGYYWQYKDKISIAGEI